MPRSTEIPAVSLQCIYIFDYTVYTSLYQILNWYIYANTKQLEVV